VLSIDVLLRIASVAETVTVTGESPLIEATSSSVGGVVDVGRIESMPLSGRQFASLAATIPGVGLGFHSDPTKSTQYSPQINGGNGRNVDYEIDGGDNNDDTVGGLLQLSPREAIQEFNLHDHPAAFGPTSRSDARHSGSFAAVSLLKGFTISPIFLYRSPLPAGITAGSDRNLNSENNDLPDRAFQFDGVGNAPKDIGPCETWNCGRGAWRTQMNLRVSHAFEIGGRARIEAMGRDLQLAEREEPVDVRDQCDERAFHAAERVLGRLPEPRAARRPVRFAV
jgi:hypothetical protein